MGEVVDMFQLFMNRSVVLFLLFQSIPFLSCSSFDSTNSIIRSPGWLKLAEATEDVEGEIGKLLISFLRLNDFHAMISIGIITCIFSPLSRLSQEDAEEVKDNIL